MHYKITLLAFLILSTSNTLLAEDNVPIKFETLPDAVKKTSLSLFDQKNITKIQKISDKGHVKFEIETDKTKDKKDFISQKIVIANSGKIMEFSKEVPYFSLTLEQMDEIKKRYPEIKVDVVESIQLHYFDVLGKINGQNIKFRLLENAVIEEIQPDERKSQPDQEDIQPEQEDYQPEQEQTIDE